MDVRMPDGTIVQNVPDGMTQAQLLKMVNNTKMKAPEVFNGASVGADATPSKPYDFGDFTPAIRSAMNVGQAMTFGFGDEIAGKLGADPARYRATVDQFRQDFPKSGMLGTVAGSLLIPGGVGKLAVTSPWQAASVAGGLAGGLQSLGDAPSDQPVRDTAQNAILDSATGLALGPAMMGTMKVGGAAVSPVVTPIASKLSQWIPGLSGHLDSLLARRGVVRGLDRDNLSIPDVSARMSELGPEARFADAGGESTRRVLDINATLPGKTKDSLEQLIANRQMGRRDRLQPAVDLVTGDMGRAMPQIESLTAQQKQAAAPLYAKLDAMEVPGDSKLLDLLNTAERQGLFKRAAQNADLLTAEGGKPFSLGKMTGGTQGQTIMTDQYGNILKDVKAPVEPQTRSLLNELKKDGGIHPSEVSDLGVGAIHKDYPTLLNRRGKTMDQIVEWMNQKGWLNDAEVSIADKSGVGGSHELARDMIRGALNRESVVHPADGEAVYAYNDAMQQLADAGIRQVKIPGVPLSRNSQNFAVTDLNHVKMAADSAYEEAIAKGDNTTARSLTIYKKALTDKIDELTGGAYKPALEAFAGPEALKSAIANGRKFLQQPDDVLGTAMGGLTASEKEAFRLGAGEALRSKFGSEGGQTEMLKAWKSDNLKDKLKILLGDDAKYGDLMSMLKNEGTLKKLESVGRGSQTAARLAGAEDSALDIASGVASGGIAGGLKALATMYRRASTPEQIRDEMSRMLMARKNSGLLGSLEDTQNAMRQNASGFGAATGAATGLLGADIRSKFNR